MNKIDLIYISNNKKGNDKKFSSNDVLSISYWNETSLKSHELEMCIPYQYDICIGQKYNQTNVCLLKYNDKYRIESMDIISKYYKFSNGNNITLENLQKMCKLSCDSKISLDWTKISLNKDSSIASKKFLACYIPKNNKIDIGYSNRYLTAVNTTNDEDCFLVCLIENGRPLFDTTFAVNGKDFRLFYNLKSFKNIEFSQLISKVGNKYKKGEGSCVFDEWDIMFSDYVKVEEPPLETKEFMFGCKKKGFELGRVYSYIDNEYSSSGNFITTYCELIYNNTQYCVCLTESHSTDYDGICCFCIPGYEMGKNSFLDDALEKCWGNNTKLLVKRVCNYLVTGNEYRDMV